MLVLKISHLIKLTRCIQFSALYIISKELSIKKLIGFHQRKKHVVINKRSNRDTFELIAYTNAGGLERSGAELYSLDCLVAQNKGNT